VKAQSTGQGGVKATPGQYPKRWACKQLVKHEYQAKSLGRYCCVMPKHPFQLIQWVGLF